MNAAASKATDVQHLPQFCVMPDGVVTGNRPRTYLRQPLRQSGASGKRCNGVLVAEFRVPGIGQCRGRALAAVQKSAKPFLPPDKNLGHIRTDNKRNDPINGRLALVDVGVAKDPP